MFSLFGSDRRARAASEASSATSGFSAWRASSRLRKSTGVFRSNGSPFSLSLMSAPSSAELPARRGRPPGEATQPPREGQQLGEADLHHGLFGRVHDGQR